AVPFVLQRIAVAGAAVVTAGAAVAVTAGAVEPVPAAATAGVAGAGAAGPVAQRGHAIAVDDLDALERHLGNPLPPQVHDLVEVAGGTGGARDLGQLALESDHELMHEVDVFVSHHRVGAVGGGEAVLAPEQAF